MDQGEHEDYLKELATAPGEIIDLAPAALALAALDHGGEALDPYLCASR